MQVCSYDGWLVRFANGYSKRANSATALYPGRLPLAEKIDHLGFAECYQYWYRVST